MKNLYLFILLTGILSCSSETKQVDEVTKEKTLPMVEDKIKREVTALQFLFNDFKGYYVGMFKAENIDYNKDPSYSNRINISLDSLDNINKMLYGHSIVAGNNRPFSGKYSYISNNCISTEVKEPGDDKYDGYFIFNVFSDKKKLTGSWQANDNSLAVPKRKFNLEKKTFSYNPNINLSKEDMGHFALEYSKRGDAMQETITDDITKFNASVDKLNVSDIENLYKGDLEIIRNMIYARHGYSFKNRRMRYFFDDYVDWYIPVSTDIRNELTEIEIQNIELLKRYEEHAEKYYDYFGR